MQFSCTVLSVAGDPIPGCSVRVLNANGVDVTPKLSGGLSPFVTGDDGLFTYTYPVFPPFPPLTIGFYTFVTSAPGYEPFSGMPFNRTEPISGWDAVTLVLSPKTLGEGVEIVREGSPYVSPMFPVELTVQGQAPGAEWEQIETTVTSDSGAASAILVPVIDGEAVVNLQARLSLDPVLELVSDTVPAIVDRSFAQKFTATFKTITPSGTFPLAGEVEVWAANAFPILNENDLLNFTNDGDSGLAEWLTPFADSELPKFLGHYADAMIWLPIVTGAVELQYTFKNINRVVLEETGVVIDPALFASGYPIRIRIPEPIPGAYYLQLAIEIAGIVQTKPLNVRYVYA